MSVDLVYGGKRILNLPGHHGTATICAEVYRQKQYWYTDLRISDCNRVIALDFYGPDAEDDEHENDLYKLDELIGALKDFRKGLLRARRACGR